MITPSQALALLAKAVGNRAATFREGQWEAIDAIVNQQSRLLLVERTGWGKSAVYFIATQILRASGRGPTLIVSPLLALMRNQIDAASRLGLKAVSINSTNKDDWPELEGQIDRDEADALLVSPERLANEEFVQSVLMPIANRIGLLVIDEAHCISDWGHDFRPDYKRLRQVVSRIPRGLPVLATTATANERVIKDVQNQLGSLMVRRGPLMRKSLRLGTMRLADKASRLAWLATHIPELPGTGIVYVLTKRDADMVATWLSNNGIAASPYYSGVVASGTDSSDEYRQLLETRLLDNKLKVLVATAALGMGYDKPDLGFVIHYQAPGSLIAYYQQVGRAGRALDAAYGLLMAGSEDEDIHDFFRESAFPAEEHVNALLEALDGTDGLSIPQLEALVNLRKGRLEHAIKYLSVENPSPVVKAGTRWRRTAVRYSLDRETIRRLTSQRESEWHDVLRYVDSQKCLMRHLAEQLNDPFARDCGLCSVCRGEPVVSLSVRPNLLVTAQRFVRSSEFPLQPKAQVAAGAFRHYGWKGNLAQEHRAEEGRVLARWGDAGWGQALLEGKRAGRIGDDLVAAAAEMIRERWRPNPPPRWVTCVPSLKHPTLVPDFAARVAKVLGLPFRPAVRKLRDTEPQKLQENRFHQCRNLDGAFQVTGEVSSEPVLLLDDVVDSGWTMTVIAALLRQAGAGPVWPVAVASASSGD